MTHPRRSFLKRTATKSGVYKMSGLSRLEQVRMLKESVVHVKTSACLLLCWIIEKSDTPAPYRGCSWHMEQWDWLNQ